MVRNDTAPRRYTYLLGPNESCRTAAERFELLARKGSDATIADVRAAFDKEPLTREFFKRFEAAIDAVKTDLENYQALPSAQAYSRAQLLLERLLFLYFVQNRGWLDQKRNFLLDHFTAHRAVPNAYTYYADFLERVFFTLSTPPDFSGPGSKLRLDGLPFLNGGLFDDDEFAQTVLRRRDNPPLQVRNATFAEVFADLLEAFNFTAHEDTPLDQDVAVDPEMLGKVFESIVLHAEAADPDAVAPDKRKATGSYYTPRIVVHFICRESLCLYLLNRLPSDLRTPPEESSVWHTLSEKHVELSYSGRQVVVADRSRKDLAKWPWGFDVGSAPAISVLEAGNAPLLDFLAGEIGFDLVTGSDDFFVIHGDLARRLEVRASLLKQYFFGEDIRDWKLNAGAAAIFPYLHGKSVELGDTGLSRYATLFRSHLERRIYFGKSPKERGMNWWEYAIVLWSKRSSPLRLAFCQIATHAHFIRASSERLFKEKAPIIKLPNSAKQSDYDLLAGLLNSSASLFWLKHVCFSKRESEEGSTDTYFEFAGNKLDKLPIPQSVSESLRGKPSQLAQQLTILSDACWERGEQLPGLALAKAFENDGEAYHSWNAALPGHVAPTRVLTPAFVTTAQLRARLDSAIKLREHLRSEMMALQEEMDWLVYHAYGLGPSKASSAAMNWAMPADRSTVTPITEDQRAFRFWTAAGGDFDKAWTAIPPDWSEPRRKLWGARLQCIRDDEHIRRIETAVYKRRWDEQWKVSNRWMSGPIAYAQELVDAFRWWLAEKAEWHLEHKAKGPLSFDIWSTALAGDPRIEAAWPVVAGASHQVTLWKIEQNDKKSIKPPKLDASSAAFTRFFRDMVNDETVPEGIPPAVPWEELAKKGAKVSPSTKSIRGKLNVPRERFTLTATGHYRQAKPI